MSSITRTNVYSSSLRRACSQARPSLSTFHSRLEHQHHNSGEGPQLSGKSEKQVSGRFPVEGLSNGLNNPIQMRQFSTITTLWAEKKPKSSEGLKPKILDENPPTGEEEPEDVKKHNEEFARRADRAYESIPNEEPAKDKASTKSKSKGEEDQAAGKK